MNRGIRKAVALALVLACCVGSFGCGTFEVIGGADLGEESGVASGDVVRLAVDDARSGLSRVDEVTQDGLVVRPWARGATRTPARLVGWKTIRSIEILRVDERATVLCVMAVLTAVTALKFATEDSWSPPTPFGD